MTAPQACHEYDPWGCESDETGDLVHPADCRVCGMRAREHKATAPPANPDVLTVDEGAELLRIGRRQMYEAIGRGEIPHRRIGRIIRLSRAELMRWLEGSCGLHQKGTI